MTKNYQEKSLRELTFAIVGLGLIGGSYAKALRQLRARKILGMDISHGIAHACLNANMIDEVVEADGCNLKEADVIICSVYPDAIVSFVRQNVQNFGEGMLMTDATGVKGTMPLEIQELLPEGCEFISGHPMAGRQGSGLGMSDASIFNNSNYISYLRKGIPRKPFIGWKSFPGLLAAPVLSGFPWKTMTKSLPTPVTCPILRRCLW